MEKFFCEICQTEVVMPVTSLDYTGKIFCSKHYYEAKKLMLNSVDVWVKTITSGCACDNCNIDYPSCNNCVGA